MLNLIKKIKKHYRSLLHNLEKDFNIKNDSTIAKKIIENYLSLADN
jgi:hypothetical protein